jgi:hypothetical protein
MLAALSYVGYVLILIGGILLSLFGSVSLIGSAFLIFSPLAFLSKTVYSLVEIILGIICIIGSKWVKNITWAIILLVLGIVAGGIGGILVVFGSLIGLLTQIIK